MLLARRSLRKFPAALLSRRRLLSSRASAVLDALDIPTTPTELSGVYDGEWKGSGDVFQSVCPATGEVLANVKSVRNLAALRLQFVLFAYCPLPPHQQASPAELHEALDRTREAYVYFRSIPAPRRGEIIRQIREALAAKVRLCCITLVARLLSCDIYALSLSLCFLFFLQRDELGALVSLEMGKIRTEGVGEVQEFVDIVSDLGSTFALLEQDY
jgi:aldehyde dehydrogenase family 7 member A1